MRDESRREAQRQARQELHQRFLDGAHGGLPTPGQPEIIGASLPAPALSEEHTSADELALAAANTTQFDAAEPAPWQTPHHGHHVRQDEAQPAGDPAAGISAPVAAAHLYQEEPESQVRARRQRSKRRRNLVMAATVLIFALVVAGAGFTVRGIYKAFNPDDYPGPGGAQVEFVVEDGWGVGIISRKLEELDVVSDDKLFVKAMDASAAGNKVIHPGTYVLQKQLPAAEAVDLMVDNRPDKVFYVGLKQNMRLNAALEEITKGSGLELKELTELANDPERFGLPREAKNLEGYLHPGEYRFALDTSAEEVLRQLVDSTTATLAEHGVNDPAQGYRMLKIASILQAEAQPKDYAVVAGALNNRLSEQNDQTHGLLQVDSAVIYGLDRYTLQFSKQEKADKSNPYNTYVHRGLPPTPIGSPADSAIAAAVNPQENDFYYWVTVNIATGETKFARTYQEHQRYQQEFRDWCQANPGQC